jgi:hypothetical protein
VHGTAFLRLVAVSVVLLAASGCYRGYVIDKKNNRVVYQTWDEGNGTKRFPVLGADAATFEAFKIPGVGGDFGRDARKVFEGPKKIEWADPKSFRSFGSNFRDDRAVFRDDRAIFMRYGVSRNIVRVEAADPDTFTRIKPGVWRDRERVFYGLQGFVPRDIASFRLLDRDGWARDDEAFYWYGRELPGVDADSFAICAADNTFARDATAVYWKGWPVPGCDPVTFQPVRPPGQSRAWQDGGRLWDHGGRTDREEWIFRVVDESSGDDHRGPPRMAFRRRPLPVARQ